MKYAPQPMFRLAVTLSLALAAACDDSKGSSSGVSGSKSIDEVTDAEAKKVCVWMNDLLADSFTVEQGCTVDAVEETSSAAECRAIVQECKQDAEGGPSDDVDEGEADCDEAAALEDPSPGCSKITVSDFESCVKALKRAAEELYTGASCDKPGDLPDPEFPALCKRIVTECPEMPLAGVDIEAESSSSL